jgi:Domain of unknown function (DUF5668)
VKRGVDVLSLVVGVCFMALAVLFLADQAGRIHLDLAFIGPLLLIAFGVGSVSNGLRRSKSDDDR